MHEPVEKPVSLSYMVYRALTFGAPAPWDYWRYILCKEFKWTVADFDQTAAQDIFRIMQVRDGIARSKNPDGGDEGDDEDDEAD